MQNCLFFKKINISILQRIRKKFLANEELQLSNFHNYNISVYSGI